MKKFTKLFLSCAAVAALTATVATSAMAADATVSGFEGTYADGKLSLTNAPAGTATVLVLAPGADKTAVTQEQVLYIDQKAADGAFGVDGVMGLKGAPTADGIYPIIVGYYNEASAFEKMEGSINIGVVGEEIQLGNVSGDARLNSADATCILYYDSGNKDAANIGNVGKTITVADGSAMQAGAVEAGATLLVGNVNGDARLNSADATSILYYDSGNKDVANIGNVGVTITGTITE